jgi:ribosomal protein S18 acetylase RimI-like enzyme
MSPIHYREADANDIPSMAQLRSLEWGDVEYWMKRITGYINCELHPQQALIPRVMYVALENNIVVGFIAGHLTRRYECDGELEWINVKPQFRGSGVASELLQMLAKWFVKQNAKKICVDVDPANSTARKFYKRHGAEDLNKHWLVWNDISVVLKNNK